MAVLALLSRIQFSKAESCHTSFDVSLGHGFSSRLVIVLVQMEE